MRKPYLGIVIALVFLVLINLVNFANAADNINKVFELRHNEQILAEPDQILISASVVNSNKDANIAISDNSKKMQNAIDNLKKLGIDDKNLQTSNFSITPLFEKLAKGASRSQPRQIIGYRVSNDISIQSGEIADSGKIINEIVKLGINQIHNISFSVKNADEIIEMACLKAISKTIDRAEKYSKAANIELGDIIYMTENSAQPFRRMSNRNFAMASPMLAEGAVNVPIEAGELSYSCNIHIKWKIK